MQFPNVDTIPIPAPVWLMKALGLVTLALHLVSVQLLIGTLVMVLIMSLMKGSAGLKTATHVLARRSTIIMTYVVNLGIPPLLFAQVLYGRALYTSSDLIAVFWISVVPMLMACYWLLYRAADRTARGVSPALPILGALVLAMGVGRLLSYNMTLMLRPEVWQAMYAHTASGLQLPPPEPTGTPRWAFVMVGSMLAVGIWMLLNGNLPTIDDDAKAVLRKFGKVSALLGAVGEIGLGIVAYAAQPDYVRQGLLDTPFYKVSAIVWAVGVVLALALALWSGIRPKINQLAAVLGAVMCIVGMAGAVLVRDGIRDLTLMHAGFNVWNRHEVSNWGVVGIFLALFVISLGVIGWLLLVMRQATPVSEQVASS